MNYPLGMNCLRHIDKKESRNRRIFPFTLALFSFLIDFYLARWYTIMRMKYKGPINVLHNTRP